MIADMHVHSTFSPDGISTMEEQCIAALEKGERIICFTDHVDYNVAEKNNGIIKDNSKANFIIEEYLIEIDRLRKKYPELKILKGIEFSEPHLFKKEFERYSQYPFDYILGSVHHCYEGVFPGAANISEDEAIKEYYDIMIRSLEECFFDGMAHLDFPRSFFDHWNISETIINRILELMVEKSISLEINTSSLIDNNDMPMIIVMNCMLSGLIFCCPHIYI